jgi:hypothetical protein
MMKNEIIKINKISKEPNKIKKKRKIKIYLEPTIMVQEKEITWEIIL